VTPRPAEIVRHTMFGPDKAPAEFVSVAESDGSEDLLVYRVHYQGVSRPAGIAGHHLIVLNVGPPVPAECHVGSASLNHTSESGNLTVIPAETEWKAAMGHGAEMVVAAIPKARLAVSAASAFDGMPSIEPLLRAQNAELLSVLREMTLADRPNIADEVAWQTLSDELVMRLLGTFGGPEPRHDRGYLSPQAIAAINAFLRDNLDRTVPIDEMADVAGQTPSHFPRLFRRTLQMSPHQYVMRLRLMRARALICRGCPLSEAAAEAGFSDQSHMTNWLRRIYGVTPGQLVRSR
jgi:AraC family transcriptional regulator